MKLRQTILVFLIVLATNFIVSAQSLNNSPLPAPTGMVNDFANIIDDTVQAQIEKKLRDFQSKSNPAVEIAVVTVKTTGDRPIFDYSLAVARGWKIGSKDDDNPSLLMLIAIDDKKYFTQISKDLEDELTDGISGQIQRQNLIPAFRAGDYTKGINDTVDAFIKTIEERRSNPTRTPKPASTKSVGLSSGTIFCCIVIFIVIVIVFIVISSIGKGGGSGGSGGGRDRWRSGGFGGNSSNNDYSPPIVIWGGGGGSSDWGSSSGGGDSWGGFGGGGDFGGGGSGGDW